MHNLYWFRKSLRIHDNPGLLKVSLSKSAHTCMFILDPFFIEKSRVGVNRWRFLFEALADLDASLKSVGSRLLVLRGNPTTILEAALADPNLHLYFERDTEPHAITRDSEVTAFAPTRVHVNCSHTLYDATTIKCQKTPVKYESFLKIVSGIKIEECVDDIETFSSNVVVHESLKEYGGGDGLFSIPTLEEVKLTPPAISSLFLGGETAALSRLKSYFSSPETVAAFAKPDTAPTDFNPPSTTVLSPYLKFGCLSARKFYHSILEVYATHKGHTQPPTSLLGQLLWREFYYFVGYNTPNFHKMVDNPICLQVPWECPLPTDSSPHLIAWKNAQTGFPFIDAIMTQLKNEGWIHHLARHSVACFLTRGDLYINWERGVEVFDELLLDADYFVNAGNWMWLSASAFFTQYYRVYSPIAFGKKTDPSGLFIKHYLPHLSEVPKAFIYEPWKMSKAQQKAANCVLGVDYPHPIVDHDVVRKSGIEGLKEAYAKRRGDGESEPAVKKESSAVKKESAPKRVKR